MLIVFSGIILKSSAPKKLPIKDAPSAIVAMLQFICLLFAYFSVAVKVPAKALSLLLPAAYAGIDLLNNKLVKK